MALHHYMITCPGKLWGRSQLCGAVCSVGYGSLWGLVGGVFVLPFKNSVQVYPCFKINIFNCLLVWLLREVVPLDLQGHSCVLVVL